MAKVSGIVVEIKTRSVAGKFGRPGTAYNIVLDDGNSYSAGFKSPPCSAGDKVQFDVVMNGKYSNADFNSIEVLGKGAVPAAASTSYSPSRSSGGGFPVATDSDKYAIIRQNALTNAVATLGRFTQDNPAATQTLDELVEQIIEVAYKFTDFTSGQREVKAVEEGTKE